MSLKTMKEVIVLWDKQSVVHCGQRSRQCSPHPPMFGGRDVGYTNPEDLREALRKIKEVRGTVRRITTSREARDRWIGRS